MRLTDEALVRWAELRDAEGGLPELVRRLIRATVDVSSLHRLEMPSDEGISKPGVDGLVEVREGNDFVPRGVSVWEMGRGQFFRAKAQKDYRTRTDAPPPEVGPTTATFVFVTPRRWPQPDLSNWQLERRAESEWRDVAVIDADKLIEWVRAAPPVEVWLAEQLGWSSPLRSLERAWREWSRATVPASSKALVLAGRDSQREELRAWLERPPGVLRIHASHPDEVAAFCWATLRHLPVSVREGWLARALIVRSEDELRRLSVERTPMLLIARGCKLGLARLTAEQGHHVVLADADRPGAGTLELGPLDPPRVEVALEGMGYAEDARRLILELRGTLPGPGVSMSALRRALGALEDELPAELIPLVLAGAWTEHAADMEAVCELLGEGPERLRVLQRRHSGAIDAPLVVSGPRWRWASRRDAWRQLEPRLSEGDLERFERVVVSVIEGDACSGELRAGLLEGLLLIAAASQREREARVARVVFRLLGGEGRGWEGLGSQGLALLAEAAPASFVRCAGERLRGGQAEPHSEWIGALEVLAWSETHLFEVTELLAQIADSCEGGVGEHARRSLKEIYLSWNPHTSASAEARAANLETLARHHPDFTMELLLELLPKAGLGDISTQTRRPKIRDWDRAQEPVTWGEIRDHGLRLWRQIERMVQGDAALWLRVFPRLTELSLDDELRDEALDALCELDVAQLVPAQRQELRRELRETIHHHRQIPDAGWSLPEHRLERLEELHDTLAPERPVDALAWVFDNGPALLHPPALAAWRETDDAIRQAQREAAQRLRASSTPAELVALADRVEDPQALGVALGSLEVDQPPIALLRGSLDMDEAAAGESRRGLFLRGLGYALHEARGYDAWADARLVALPLWARAELMLGHPWRPETWEIVEAQGPELAQAYWLRAPIRPYETENVERLLRSIFRVGRVADALTLAASALTRTEGSSLDLALLAELLEAAARVVEASPEHEVFESRCVHALLEQLRAAGERWRETLLRLEWALLPSLDLFAGHHPKLLYAKLSEDPAYFVDMVRRANPQSALRDAEQKFCGKAQRLLFHWNTLPGQIGDNSVDSMQLRAWVANARAQLHQAGQARAGDAQLGDVLARVPAHTQGSWPPQFLCELLDELDDPRGIEDALVTARGNRRSMGLRRVDPERDRREADALHAQARAMRARWPRMARVLEQLALRREHDAQFWEERARERSDWTARATTKERLEAALDIFEARGRYVFDLDDLDEPLRQASDLHHQLDALPRVAKLPDGAYVVVRPEYRQLGAPPPSWFIDELMRRARVDYCVGLLSAAALHGAADQKPQSFQVLVAEAMEPARVGELAIEFVHRAREQAFDARRVNTQTGTMAVATPAATVFDLAEFYERSGGRGAVVAVYEDLLDDVDIEDLVKASASYPRYVVEQAATLIHEAGHEALATALRETPPKTAHGALT